MTFHTSNYVNFYLDGILNKFSIFPLNNNTNTFISFIDFKKKTKFSSLILKNALQNPIWNEFFCVIIINQYRKKQIDDSNTPLNQFFLNCTNFDGKN